MPQEAAEKAVQRLQQLPQEALDGLAGAAQAQASNAQKSAEAGVDSALKGLQALPVRILEGLQGLAFGVVSSITGAIQRRIDEIVQAIVDTPNMAKREVTEGIKKIPGTLKEGVNKAVAKPLQDSVFQAQNQLEQKLQSVGGSSEGVMAAGAGAQFLQGS
eukprot:symbB.v1.2.035549.t1/scaffold4815.1/size34420/2